MQIFNKLYISLKNKDRFLVDENNEINCSLCFGELDAVAVVTVLWDKKSGIIVLCRKCYKKRKKSTVKEIFVVQVVDHIPKDTKPYILHKPILQNSNNLSTLDIDGINKKGGVTIDRTKYANRSNRLQSLNYEEHKQHVLEDIKMTDKKLTYDEGLNVLDELFEASKEVKT